MMTQPPSPDTKNQPGVDLTRFSQADALDPLRYKTQLEAVEHISHALFQSIDLDELVETTLHIALEEVGAEAGDKPVPRGTGIAWDKGISGAVFQTGEARITNQVDQDPTHLRSVDQTTGFVTHDMIVVPLRRWRGEPIGVLNLLNNRDGPLRSHGCDRVAVGLRRSATIVGGLEPRMNRQTNEDLRQASHY